MMFPPADFLQRYRSSREGKRNAGAIQFSSSLRKQGPITADVDVRAGRGPSRGNRRSLWLWAPLSRGRRGSFYEGDTDGGILLRRGHTRSRRLGACALALI